MDTLVLRNVGNSPLYVDDLGIEILVGEDFDILSSFTAEDITESLDFPSVMLQGAQIVLNNTITMSLQDTIDYLTPLTRWDKIDYAYITGKDDISDILNTELEELTDGSDTSLHIHDGRYYTETELQTPGGATIHYDNIVGAPAGDFRIEGGDLYFKDLDRQGKWLSAAEEKYVWNEKNVDGKYMSIGNSTSSATGYLLPQDFTLTKLAITSTGNPTKEIQIRKGSTTISTLNLVGGEHISTNLNIDMSGGDLLKIFVSGAGSKISNVVVTLFGKWRTV